MAPPKIWNAIEKSCEACGMKFLAETSYAITKQRFCSRTCSLPLVQASRRRPKHERDCERCSVSIVRDASQFANRQHVFCSMKCRGEWQTEHGVMSGENNGAWKGGTSTWWKQKARERDDFTCQVEDCNIRDTGKRTHAHHKLPVEAGGTDDLSNLITLCHHHHQRAEHQMLMTLCEQFPDAVKEIVAEMYG